MTAAAERLDPTFVAPKPARDAAHRVSDPPRTWISGKPLPLDITVAAENEPRVTVVYRSGSDRKTLNLTARRSYQYLGTVPGEDVRPGTLVYRVVVRSPQGTPLSPEAAWRNHRPRTTRRATACRTGRQHSYPAILGCRISPYPG